MLGLVWLDSVLHLHYCTITLHCTISGIHHGRGLYTRLLVYVAKHTEHEIKDQGWEDCSLPNLSQFVMHPSVYVI